MRSSAQTVFARAGRHAEIAFALSCMNSVYGINEIPFCETKPILDDDGRRAAAAKAMLDICGDKDRVVTPSPDLSLPADRPLPFSAPPHSFRDRCFPKGW